MRQRPSLLHQVDEVGDEVREGVIDDDVAVVITHLVAEGCRRQVAVDIRRNRLQVSDIGVGVVAADGKDRATRTVDGAHARGVIAAQAVAVTGTERIGRPGMWWTAPLRRTRVRRAMMYRTM
jgi:hypothetical protein